MSERMTRVLALAIGVGVTSFVYGLDFATYGSKAITLPDWFGYLSSPGLLLSFPIQPDGVHGSINIVKLTFVMNAAFYSGAAYLVLRFLANRRRLRSH